MSVTAVTPKTTTAAVGEVWDLGVKVTPIPDVDPNTGSPVRFEVSRPDAGGTSTVAATPGATAGVFTAQYVFHTEGEHTAVAVVRGETEDADAKTLDGFTAAVEPQPESAAQGVADPTDDPDPAPGGNTES